MKKILAVLLSVLMSLGSVSVFGAETAETADMHIYIRTIDTSEVTQYFKENLSSWDFSRVGFSESSYVGTPFSLEEQNDVEDVEIKDFGGLNTYEFCFPLITDGKITSCVLFTYFREEGIGYSFVPYFLGDEGLKQLSDGDTYSIIETGDLPESVLAVSDTRQVIFRKTDTYRESYKTPYEGKETTVVDIMQPLDLSASEEASMKRGTDEQTALWKDSIVNDKTLTTIWLEEEGYLNQNGRVLVPLRAMAEALECDITWDQSSKTATAVKDKTTVVFTIDKSTYTVNGKEKSLDSPAVLEGGAAYIPARAMAEAFGAEIAYNGAAKTVTIAY